MTSSRAGRYGTLLSVVLALLLAAALAACSGEGDPGGGSGSAERGAENFIKMLSGDAEGVANLDVAALEGDDGFSDLRRSVESDWDFDSYGIDLWDLGYMAYAEEDSGGDVFLLGGADDRDLRDELDDRGYDDDEIYGVEVWIDSSSTWEAFAFLPGGAVLIAYYEDDMEDMLQRRDRGGSSLDDELGDVWRALPSGYLRAGGANCDDVADGCVGLGLSLEKENAREGKLVMLIEFDSERDAERAEDDIEDNWDDRDDCDDLAVSQSGSRVRAEVVCDLDEFESLGGF